MTNGALESPVSACGTNRNNPIGPSRAGAAEPWLPPGVKFLNEPAKTADLKSDYTVPARIPACRWGLHIHERCTSHSTSVHLGGAGVLPAPAFWRREAQRQKNA